MMETKLEKMIHDAHTARVVYARACRTLYEELHIRDPLIGEMLRLGAKEHRALRREGEQY